MSFISSDLNKQAQALEVTFQGQENHITHKPVSTIFIWMRNLISNHILERKTQMYIRLETLVY